MELRAIMDSLQLKLVNGEELEADVEIKGCYIGDLLSNVMAHAHYGDLWLTVQIHQNVVAVAELLNVGAIVFVEGHLPHEDTILKAEQEKITLLTTEESAYDIAARLNTIGLKRQES